MLITINSEALHIRRRSRARASMDAPLTGIAALAAIFGLGLATQADAAPDTAMNTPGLGITLQPSASDADHRVSYIDVTIVASGLEASAGAPLVTMPLVTSNTVTKANEIQGLTAAGIVAHDAVEHTYRPIAASLDFGNNRLGVDGAIHNLDQHANLRG